MSDEDHVVETSAPRERVFSVLTTTEGLSGWWSTSVKAEAAEGAAAQAEAAEGAAAEGEAVEGAAAEGEAVEFTFGGDFNPRMRITKLDPPAQLH